MCESALISKKVRTRRFRSRSYRCKSQFNHLRKAVVGFTPFTWRPIKSVSLLFFVGLVSLALTVLGQPLWVKEVHSSTKAIFDQPSTRPDRFEKPLFAATKTSETIVLKNMVQIEGDSLGLWAIDSETTTHDNAVESASDDGDLTGEFNREQSTDFSMEWSDGDPFPYGLSGAASGGICPDDATLVMTGRVRYAEPGCSDENVYVTTSDYLVCSNVPVELPDVVIPPPEEIPNVGDCLDKPLRRVRVELWKDNGLPGPGSDDMLLTSTLSDDQGLFAFCRTSAPDDAIDL